MTRPSRHGNDPGPAPMAFDAVFSTDLHADCVKFVPKTEPPVAVFACYELNEDTQVRHGKLALAQYDVGSREISIRQSISLPGVFDIQWFTDRLLGCALAEGPPQFYKYNTEEVLESVPVDIIDYPTTVPSLCMAGSESSFVTGDNRGDLHLCQDFTYQLRWRAHDAEIWYCSVDPVERNILYSGGDDFALKGWDLRAPAHAIFQDRKSHTAGVCCVDGSPLDANLLATGSYDHFLRIWDKRAMARGPMEKIDCGSGVWRFAWHPERPDWLAVAAMRAGFHVVARQASDDQHAPFIWSDSSVGEHVAYGIDWWNGRATTPSSLLASCSFYNNQGQFTGISA